MTTNGTDNTRPSAAAYDQANTAIVRQSFGSMEMEVGRETQAIAAAETAKALVQARYIVAMQRPRDVEDVRVRLLKHCKRPRFAEIAEYSKPVGGTPITGPSIRFVETALQEYGNVTVDVAAIYEDEEKRIVRISVADLERNIPYSEEATVEKYVERRSAAGQEVIGERKKKNGDIVFKCKATEDDFANKLAAAVSKKIRNLGLRILPADIVDEAMWECSETRRLKVKEDPDAATRKIADSFAAMGVNPAALKEYLGHEIAASSPAEIDELRKVYTAIRDGETTWKATIEARLGTAAGDAKPTDPQADKLKAKLAEAPAKDKAPSSKPEGKKADTKPQWRPANGGLECSYPDGKRGSIRKVKGSEDDYTWAVTDAEGEQIADGMSAGIENAKAHAEKAAGK